MKIQVRCLIDKSLAFRKKEGERRLRVCWVLGVGEAVRINTVLIHWTPAGLKSPSNSRPSQS